MSDRHYDSPNFPRKHLLKDINLFLLQAETLGLNTSSLEGIALVVRKPVDLGFAEDDYSAIFSAISPS